ncbi:ribosomal large subunit pseudouridine synthase C [Candidatus Blochmanniella floridana]|uniref:Pseudouridine synthase n=1 Tax=Blochmanniella floridana TaxID=203907 RepID=Q7VR15_BLOFL|nr:ribosomal large subunit pseudouridine synthase C [Candidatus Blochmannia floridanus]
MTENNISLHWLKVSDHCAGQRVDNFLSFYLKTVPKSMIYRMIRIGKVRVNKKRIKFQYRLKIGDLLKIPAIKYVKIRQSCMCNISEMMFLQNTVIYEDEHLLVLNKPSGISVHGGGDNKLQLNIIDALRMLRPKIRFLWLVHRLDRDTSGLLLIAKSRIVLIKLHEQLRLQKIQKTYLAIVYGSWDTHITSISAPLFKKKDYIKNINVVFIDSKFGKLAQTCFQVKERFKNIATLLNIIPITGRTHQIRVHTQYAQCPIIGDHVYGKQKVNVQFKKLGWNRLFLHASTLCFIHPCTEEKMNISAPVDQSFYDCLSFLRKLVN